jgi:hypothetical protein
MPSYRAAGSGAVRSPPLRRKLFTLAAGVSAVVDADDGKVLATLPIGAGVDAGSFNPAIMEAFSSQRDGTLTVIKENGPADFAVEQTVQAKVGAKTSTLDAKTNRIFLITAEQQAAPAPAAEAQGGAGRGRGGRGQMVPDSFAILVVGKSASASPAYQAPVARRLSGPTPGAVRSAHNQSPVTGVPAPLAHLNGALSLYNDSCRHPRLPGDERP